MPAGKGKKRRVIAGIARKKAEDKQAERAKKQPAETQSATPRNKVKKRG